MIGQIRDMNLIGNEDFLTHQAIEPWKRLHGKLKKSISLYFKKNQWSRDSMSLSCVSMVPARGERWIGQPF